MLVVAVSLKKKKSIPPAPRSHGCAGHGDGRKPVAAIAPRIAFTSRRAGSNVTSISSPMCSAVTDTAPGSAITASCTRCSQPPQVMPATAIVSVTTALLGAGARGRGNRCHRRHVGGDVLGVLALEQVRGHRRRVCVGEPQHDLLAHQRLERRVLEALGPRLHVCLVQVWADRALGTGVRQRVAASAGGDEQLLAVREIGLPGPGDAALDATAGYGESHCAQHGGGYERCQRASHGGEAYQLTRGPCAGYAPRQVTASAACSAASARASASARPSANPNSKPATNVSPAP